MHFVVDAQLPPALARVLATWGHTAEHIYDRFPQNVSDLEIWQYAQSCKGVIVSKDEDFPQRVRAVDQSPQVIWLRVGNTSNRALIMWLQPIWPEIERSLKLGERLIEVV